MSFPNNQRIMDALKSMASIYQSQGNIHKAKAYRNAIDTIKSFPCEITSTSQLQGAKGIGKAMLEKVSELLATGELQQAEAATADPINAALKLFTSVHGIGPALANKLVHEHHFRTLEDLRNSGMHLPQQVLLGLKYYSDAQQRIPFDEVDVHWKYVLDLAQAQIDSKMIVVVCGSHRRLAKSSGDVDMLLTHPGSHSDSGATYVYLRRLVELLKTKHYIVDTLVEGPTKFMGYCTLHSPPVRRLDLRWIPYNCFFPSLLYFTGSDLFNVNMRTLALKKGFTINEYGIYPLLSPGSDAKGDVIEVESEEEIFRIIGMDYVEPKGRG